MLLTTMSSVVIVNYFRRILCTYLQVFTIFVSCLRHAQSLDDHVSLTRFAGVC